MDRAGSVATDLHHLLHRHRAGGAALHPAGVAAGGLIENLLPDTILPNLARRMGRFGIPAVALGAGVLPTCECGVVSVARGLMRKGLPTAHTVTYLLAAPILN